jgi:hypothetical protein
MSTKIRTGDLFLANRWSVESLITHALDKETRWSDVGIFDVKNLNNNKHDGDFEVNVLIMTHDGARKVPLNDVLRDPTLQMAAHRELTSRDRASLTLSISNAIASVIGSPKENISNLVSNANLESKREGMTSSELVSTVLNKVKLITHSNDILISNFQQGGILDKIYGNESPLFPVSASQKDEGGEDPIITIAKRDTELIIEQYIASNPSSIYHAIQTRKTPVKNEKQFNNDYNKNGEIYPEQYPGLQSSSYAYAAKKNQSTLQGTVDASDASVNRVIKEASDRAVYDKKFRPKP